MRRRLPWSSVIRVGAGQGGRRVVWDFPLSGVPTKNIACRWATIPWQGTCSQMKMSLRTDTRCCSCPGFRAGNNCVGRRGGWRLCRGLWWAVRQVACVLWRVVWSMNAFGRASSFLCVGAARRGVAPAPLKTGVHDDGVTCICIRILRPRLPPSILLYVGSAHARFHSLRSRADAAPHSGLGARGADS